MATILEDASVRMDTPLLVGELSVELSEFSCTLFCYVLPCVHLESLGRQTGLLYWKCIFSLTLKNVS